MLHQKVQQLPRRLAKETIKLVVNLNRVKAETKGIGTISHSQPKPTAIFAFGWAILFSARSKPDKTC
jgi:hypothetical protein